MESAGGLDQSGCVIFERIRGVHRPHGRRPRPPEPWAQMPIWAQPGASLSVRPSGSSGPWHLQLADLPLSPGPRAGSASTCRGAAVA
jgi:hypothetical protein